MIVERQAVKLRAQIGELHRGRTVVCASMWIGRLEWHSFADPFL